MHWESAAFLKLFHINIVTFNYFKTQQIKLLNLILSTPKFLETFWNVYLAAMQAPKSRLDIFLAAIDSSSKKSNGSLPLTSTTSGGQNPLPTLRSLLTWGGTGTNSDHPLCTTSAPQNAFQLPAKWSFNAPIAGLIITCLYFMGCETDSILRVLESYNFCDSIDLVARYVKEAKPLRHHEYGPFPEGRITYIEPHTGITCITDFAGVCQSRK